jgi:hypothetical protein
MIKCYVVFSFANSLHIAITRTYHAIEASVEIIGFCRLWGFLRATYVRIKNLLH